MDDEELIEYRIPDNILESKRIWGFRKRNWIEGIICACIVGYIIYKISFVIRVKIILIVILFASILLINLVGIKDQSLIEGIMNFIKACKLSKKYHMRKPNEERSEKSGMAQSNTNNIGGVSIADRVADFIKAKFKEYKKKRS